MAHTFVAVDNARKAKRADGRRDKRMGEMDSLMLSVKEHAPEILRMTPEGTETPRAIRLQVAQSINRVEKANKNLGGTLSAWTGDDEAVYVQFTASANGAAPASAPAAPAGVAPKK